MILLAVALAHAAASRQIVGAPVVGVNVALPLRGGRPGFGVDIGYQTQGYVERDATIDGDFVFWADEVPALNSGPVLHVWHADRAWTCSLGARVAVAWPLRVGTQAGWYPGPALGGELGLALSTAGWVGLDLAAVADAPWVEARAGVTWVPGFLASPKLDAAPAESGDMPAWGRSPWRGARVQVGGFSPLEVPKNWEGSVWREPG